MISDDMLPPTKTFSGEHFCDGHIAGEFDGGKVVAALRRVRELRAGV